MTTPEFLRSQMLNTPTPSTTPRTDALYTHAEHHALARQLERELAAANAEIARLNATDQHIPTPRPNITEHGPAWIEAASLRIADLETELAEWQKANATLRADLADARSQIRELCTGEKS